MKEAPEYMNDVVKNVQDELVEIDLNDGKECEKAGENYQGFV